MLELTGTLPQTTANVTQKHLPDKDTNYIT